MHPAESFREAVQSVWFIQLLLQIESNGHSVSYGRLDQYLYRFLADDLASGVITEEDACELLENLWIKTYSINKIRSWAQTRTTAGNPLYQNVTIGGQTPEGRDAVNPLSFLVLRSIGARAFPAEPDGAVPPRHADDFR
jgi:formate C-acetyltransferase